MKDGPRDVEGIRDAKRALGDEYGGRDWFRGVGIAASPKGLVLRLNVDPEANIAEGEIPDRYRGFTVHVVRIGRYEARRPRRRQG